VVRFGSDEIRAEIDALGKEENYISKIGQVVENIVAAKSNAITALNYVDPLLRSQLTGFSWPLGKCLACGSSQYHPELPAKCRKCGSKINSTGDD
jgi:hypothetical protein